MFGNLLKKLGVGDVASRLSGHTDLLEAIAAGGMLIAAADGDIEDEEVAEVLTQIQNHPALSQAFGTSEIERVVNKMAQRAKSGITGRVGLWKEIEDVSSNADSAELVLTVMIDVSRSDGEMEPAEKVVLEKVAKKLALNLQTYLEA